MNGFRENEPMGAHTSMKAGGPAAGFYEPEDEAGLVSLVSGLHEAGKPFFLLGNGTNVIVRDSGYAGAIVSTLKALRGVFAGLGGGKLSAGAGESLARACRAAAEAGLSGLEALSGIPGTVGGAVYMNAGAYGSEIADTLVSARAYDMDNRKHITLTNEECGFGYRDSVFRKTPLIILSAEFALFPGNRQEIEGRMSEFARKRNDKQPVDLPSAGSFFKRPEGDYAGRLIEAAGMKGARVGGAQVSEKHAGFIVNAGGATASDVLALAGMVKEKVFEMSGIMLEEEPVILG